MRPFTTVSGPAAPLLLANVDTDVIIRIEPLTQHPPHALGPFAFAPLRYRADSSEEPGFVLNQARFRGAPILLAGANFGCGSSREAAVWALMGMGLRCVIAPSFGDIFFANCFQNGMLPVVLAEAAIADLAEVARTGLPMTVDLVERRVSIGDLAPVSFAIDESRRLSLLEGLDAIGLTQKDAPAIAAWQAADRLRRPWAWQPVRRAVPDPREP
ncbi:3-isopropylmalate dehydratase small subunit [Piscinibacter koreensis]|uniref:3-isopropylmalate dehydratase n=1 Tax=Piscinibacter koreensis TaxID=2742824 RepID=A0A7Y6NNT6_9BURK|nr:3-isopropylmalate dehydratase small subunit [Schlegelella koreensis]NUZ06601.1 3-isopropylmalate dehydratase small subunit [Schlegelella koreensis]